jgi:hypothetical protein
MHVAARPTGDETRPYFSRATVQELGDFALSYGVTRDLTAGKACTHPRFLEDFGGVRGCASMNGRRNCQVDDTY